MDSRGVEVEVVFPTNTNSSVQGMCSSGHDSRGTGCNHLCESGAYLARPMILMHGHFTGNPRFNHVLYCYGEILL